MPVKSGVKLGILKFRKPGAERRMRRGRLIRPTYGRLVDTDKTRQRRIVHRTPKLIYASATTASQSSPQCQSRAAAPGCYTTHRHKTPASCAPNRC
ncbi:hypothetical protein BW73_30135 [Escherichia coli O111:NM str. 01-3076]|nr:hypothetical protein BW73_30135 [Escherichia coli O111:NM str. 01-3076]